MRKEVRRYPRAMRRGGAGRTKRARRQRNVERDERSPPKSIAKRTAEPLLEDKRRKDQKPRRGRKSPNPNIMKGRTQRQLSHKGGKRYPVRYQGGNLEDSHAVEVLIGNGGENMDQDGKDHSQGGHHKETWRRTQGKKCPHQRS